MQSICKLLKIGCKSCKNCCSVLFANGKNCVHVRHCAVNDLMKYRIIEEGTLYHKDLKKKSNVYTFTLIND